MRIRFTADFDWSPPERKGLVTIAYKAGTTKSVRRLCGEAAIAAGVGEDLAQAEVNHVED